jgi:Tfp pilus assembly protein PilF
MDLPRVRQMLERALELDPRFAEARAWHGFTSLLMVRSGASSDSGWIYKAEEEIRAALAEDPQCGRAHSALAAVYLYQGRKEQLAEEARRAMELDPTDVDGPMWMGSYHELNGEYAQGEAIMRKLLDRDPLFFPARMNLGEYFRQQGKVAEAIREQEKILEQDPQSIYALGYLAQAYLTVGGPAKARQALERVGAEDRKNYRVRLAWALVYAGEGKAEEARRELDAEVLKASQYGSVVLTVAEVYALLEDPGQALDWLERAVRAGDDRAAWFERDPLLAAVRNEPRFRQILESIRSRKR